MRISTSRLALCCQSGLDATFDTPIRARSRSIGSRSLPMSDSGRIMNISPGLARFNIPGTSAYGAAKGAVEVLTRYLATEPRARGITANVVAPGAIETDVSGGMMRDNPEINKHVAAMAALGRVGAPDDI